MTTTGTLSPARTGRRIGLAVFAAVIALSAYLGVVGLATGWLALDDASAARLPFASPVLGAVALAVVVAAPITWLAWLAWRGDTRTDAVAFLCGVLLIGWILVELAIIRELSFFHPTYVVVGALLLWLGRHGVHDVPGMPGRRGLGH